MDFDKDNRQMCDKCYKVYSFITHSKDKKWMCDECKENLTCEVCNKTYATYLGLCKHRFIKHDLTGYIDFYTCNYCNNKAYTGLYGLAQHMDKKHEEVKSFYVKDDDFICRICNDKITTVSTVIRDDKCYRTIDKRCKCYIPFYECWENGYDSDDDPCEVNQETIEINKEVYEAKELLKNI